MKSSLAVVRFRTDVAKQFKKEGTCGLLYLAVDKPFPMEPIVIDPKQLTIYHARKMIFSACVFHFSRSSL